MTAGSEPVTRSRIAYGISASGLQCSHDSINFSALRKSCGVDEGDNLLFQRRVEELVGAAGWSSASECVSAIDRAVGAMVRSHDCIAVGASLVRRDFDRMQNGFHWNECVASSNESQKR